MEVRLTDNPANQPKRGRPFTPEDKKRVAVNVKLSPYIVELLNRFQVQEGLYTRTQAIEHLLRKQLTSTFQGQRSTD